MKLLATILLMFSGVSTYASGGGSSREDILFSLSIVAVLITLLGLVYLFEFIHKIRKDKDYREHLKAKSVHLISTIRTIFIRKKSEKDEHIDYAVSLSLNNLN